MIFTTDCSLSGGNIVNNGTFNFYGGTIQGKFSNNNLFNAKTKNNQKVLRDFYNKENAQVIVFEYQHQIREELL